MLRHRVIPIVLLDGYSVVKTIRFGVRRNLGNPITVARIYNARDVDELVLLDIDAAKEGRQIDLATVSDIARECFMPLTVGGGLRTCADISAVLAHGADKVVINTAFLGNPSFLCEAAQTFGSQCIVVSLDVKQAESGGYELYSHSGVPTDLSLERAIDLCTKYLAGEMILNDVNRDGEMNGYDHTLIRLVAKRTNIPLIVVGGAASPDDCVAAIHSGASAAAAASMFHFTNTTPLNCRNAMRAAGIPVR